MTSLLDRLASILGEILSVEVESDGALTVRHNGTFASLRVVRIVEDLDLMSLTQVLVWDLPLTKKVRDQVAREAREVNFGSLTLLEKGTRDAKTGDVMLRYNFPGAGLTDDALRTLILLVLDTGARIRGELTT
ncbi:MULTISPECIES: hypothetical protein [Mycobacterium]|uniref:YbjN domain-containing protein n=1 Tax=Mycobacterium gordonae TaxID=1778 RepID=A0A1A6B6S4_MYCGO|nr:MULTISPECIES: hypothetical protein [Mycobacterium]MBX9982796.1 hypothetical protein [Mycobacterium gordonae]MCQ4365674.1 hypothetical protein [Mycobacterium gordonae]MCV7004558.1 hypothetical protein [Mycobacterium gordonae]OBR97985.1 hypothetical protein A9W98_04440 [Mycobacterium gordonae]ODR15903.1 hypothetical protein BHQ23_31860 [Mycobacterium gordonae]